MLVAQAVDSLATEPLQRGKRLLGELAGYRSLRAVGQRYRLLELLGLLGRVEEVQVVPPDDALVRAEEVLLRQLSGVDGGLLHGLQLLRHLELSEEGLGGIEQRLAAIEKHAFLEDLAGHHLLEGSNSACSRRRSSLLTM